MIGLKPGSALALCVALLATPAHSQEVPTTSLSQPDRVCERGFTKVVGIKELRDGRVILVDEIERLILLLDSELAEGKPIGREGAGPGEYVVPSGLFSIVGDSSAVLDTPNRRLLVLGPDGEPSGVLNFEGSVGTLRAGDGQGRFYSSFQGTVRRWTPPSSVLDTVAVYPVLRNPRSREIGGLIVTSPGDVVPFSPRLVWDVDATGRIAIVYPEPYRVELVNTDGVRREGPEIPADPVSLTEGHKEQWRERQSRPRTMVSITRGNERAPSYSTTTGVRSEPSSWPEYLPPFLEDAATFAPDGRLWVQRTTPADQPPTFDVFDSEARLVGKVTLPLGRELIGFGRGTLYAIVRDELDLEYLERYSLAGVGVGR